MDDDFEERINNLSSEQLRNEFLKKSKLNEDDLKAFGLIDGSSDVEYDEEGEEEQEDGGEANKK